jgi:hypothetical protein
LTVAVAGRFDGAVGCELILTEVASEIQSCAFFDCD